MEEKKSKVLNRMQRNAFHHIPLLSLVFQSILPNNGVLLWIHFIPSILYHIWGWHAIICFDHRVWALTFLLKNNYAHVWICGEFQKITVQKLHFQQNQGATVIPNMHKIDFDIFVCFLIELLLAIKWILTWNWDS